MKLRLRQSTWIGAVILLAGLMLPVTRAEAVGFEITPVIGFRGGGQFSEAISGDQMEFEESAVGGLILAFNMDGNSFIEVSFMRQDTNMVPKQSDSTLPSYETTIDDVQLGGHYMWDKKSPFKPFVRGSLGFTRIDPTSPDTDDEYNFSFAVGGGFKTYFTEHIGLRFDGRGLFTTLSSSEAFCTSTCLDPVGTIILQVEATLGLVIAF